MLQELIRQVDHHLERTVAFSHRSNWLPKDRLPIFQSLCEIGSSLVLEVQVTEKATGKAKRHGGLFFLDCGAPVAVTQT